MNIQPSAFITTILFSCIVVDAESNGIVGLPEIQCDSSRILITMRTMRPFDGRVFLKGNSHRPECVTDFKEHPVQNDTAMQVAIDYNLCNTERIRQLSPAGVTYANSLIVQFHRRFITAGDKAYHLRCFYSEVEHTVTSRFDVSMIPTDAVEQDMQMPQCAYTVRRGSSNGPLVRHARVGDEVVHRWECSGNGDSFGMLIHSCFVEDDSGERTPILDEHGCTLDDVLLPQLSYNAAMDLAYSQTRVFKYPDNSFVYFRCQIRICSKIDSGCEGIVLFKEKLLFRAERNSGRKFPSFFCEQIQSIRSLLSAAASLDFPGCVVLPTETDVGHGDISHEQITSQQTDKTLSANLPLQPPRCNLDGNSVTGRRTRSVDSSRYNRTANMDVVTKEMLVLEEGNQSDSIIDDTSTSSRRLSLSTSLPPPPRRKDTVMRMEDSIVVRLCTNKLFLTTIFVGLVTMFGSSVAFIIYLMIKDRQKNF